MRLSLPVRVSLLILLLVATLVGVTSWWALREAEERGRAEVAARLSDALSVQSSVQQREYENLGLKALALAGDPVILVHLQDSEEELDQRDLDDQLDHLRGGADLDLLAVLGPDRQLMADSGAGRLAERGLSGSVSVASLQHREARFAHDDGTTMLSAVTTPLVRDFDLLGFLVVGSAFDDAYLQEVGRMTPAEILVIGGRGGESTVRRSTTAPPVAAEVLRTLRTLGSLEGILGSAQRQELEVDGERMLGVSAALYDVEGVQVGASLALLSLDERLRGARSLRNMLVLLGIGAALLGGLLSWLLLRGASGPIGQVLRHAQALVSGDYGSRTGVVRSDSVGDLATTLDGLAVDLDQERELAQYVAQASRRLPDPQSRPVATAAREESLALLMVDVRGRNSTAIELGPEDLLERHARDLGRVRAAVKTNAGRIEAQMGHRLLATFPSGSGSKTGDGALYRSLRAGVVILEELGEPENSFEEVDPPAIVITIGKVQTGSHSIEGEPERIAIGGGIRQLEGLLREAGSGDLVLSSNAWARLQARAESCDLEVRPQRGVLTPQEFYALSLDAARTLLQPLAGGSAEGVGAGSKPWPEQSDGLSTSDLMPAPGDQLDERYALQSIVGAGNLGRIYRAHDAELDDVVLVEASERTAFESDALLSLENRVQRARQARHPNLQRTFECGSTNRVVYTSREAPAGLDLRFLLEHAGPLPIAPALSAARQLALALDVLHAADLLHGNVAAEQVRIASDGKACLTGHGLLWPGRGGAAAAVLAGDRTPEVRAGGEASRRTDLYCLGVVFYLMFTGKAPFAEGDEGGDLPSLLDLPVDAEVVVPPTTLRTSLPAGVDPLVLAMLDDDPERRPVSAAEVAERLAQLRL